MINLPLCVCSDRSAVVPKATNRWMKAEEEGCYGEDDGRERGKEKNYKHKSIT